MTTFVNGDSYNARELLDRARSIVDLRTGDDSRQPRGLHGPTRRRASSTRRNFNFWGVTFARTTTASTRRSATGERPTWSQGEARVATAAGADDGVECPSLSPDGTRIAFKQQVGDSHGSLAHLRPRPDDHEARAPLAETRSVDDQVEWLDDNRILYWRDTGIWVVHADGSGKPAVFVRQASSPSVIRAA